MIAGEYAAVKARLSADAALTVRDTVYDSTGALFRGTYVVLFGGAPDIFGDDRVTKPQDVDSDATYVYTVRCVSTTPDGVRSTMKHAAAQLVGFVPTIAGRRCLPMRHTHGGDVEVDASVQPIVFYADPEYTLISLRG